MNKFNYHYYGHNYGGCGGCGNCSSCKPKCDPCQNNGPCPTKLDFDCIIYHKSNNQISGLQCLGLTNGATLTLFAETVDTYICQLKVLNWDLECLRDAGYTINTVQQFGEAVDVELCELQAQIDALVADMAVPITTTPTATITFSLSGDLDHHISANVNVSAIAGNKLVVLGDGLAVAPQTLSIDYTEKTLSISDGNTVDFSSLVCGVGGWLGNVVADPTAIDGQYWFRTDLDQLRIKLNGGVRQITII